MKTPQVKPENAWCVWHPDRGFIYHYLRCRASMSLRDFLNDYDGDFEYSWSAAFSDGYRCLPVQIRKRPVTK